MQLFVQLLCGRTCVVDVDTPTTSTTVESLRHQVLRKAGLPCNVAGLFLRYGGSKLQGSTTLAAAGVINEATLQLSMELRGGMDMQNRVGNKPGTGMLSSAQQQADRRERLRKLAMETTDLSKDPYFMRNHLGTFECKLCLTLHNTEGNYLAHTQGKRHQTNLKKRAARDEQLRLRQEARFGASSLKPLVRKKIIKIGMPGYRILKQRDNETGQRSLLFEIAYPEIDEATQPRHRFMSAFEQRVEPPDKNFQYVLFAAEPYETIAFKVPNRDVDKSEGKFYTKWDKNTKTFALKLCFVTDEQLAEIERKRTASTGPAPKMVRSTYTGRQ